jgi:hypothetical protein
MTEPVALPDPSIAEEKARVEAMDRRRRGRAGTIATSDRGLLSINGTVPQKKSLLGE